MTMVRGPQWRVNVTTEARCGRHPVTNIALTPALRHQTVIKDLFVKQVQRVGESSACKENKQSFQFAWDLQRYLRVSSDIDTYIKNMYRTCVGDPIVTDSSPRDSGVTFRDWKLITRY